MIITSLSTIPLIFIDRQNEEHLTQATEGESLLCLAQRNELNIEGFSPQRSPRSLCRLTSNLIQSFQERVVAPARAQPATLLLKARMSSTSCPTRKIANVTCWIWHLASQKPRAWLANSRRVILLREPNSGYHIMATSHPQA